MGGPLQIEMPSEIGLANEWNNAGQELGYPHVDLNGNYEEGKISKGDQETLLKREKSLIPVCTRF